MCLKSSRRPGWLEQWEGQGGLWKAGRGEKDPMGCDLVGHCQDVCFYTVGLVLRMRKDSVREF